MYTLPQNRTESLASPPAPLLGKRPIAEKPVRIMHVVPRLGLGGTEKTLLRLIGELGTEEFEHSICAVRGVDKAFVRDASLELPLFSAGTPDPGFQFPLFRLAKIMRKVRPQIVHSRNFGALDAVLAARLARVPFVIHSEHGYELEILGGLPLRRRLLCRALYSAANSVFTVTEDLRTFHARQSWLPCSRFDVLQNGINIDLFSNKPLLGRRFRDDFKIPADRLVVGSVGRLVPIKGHRTLLEGSELAVARGVNLHVVLVGAGPELENLRSYAESSSSLNGRVTFVGASTRVPDALNAMDIFVLPSAAEGMSNTVLEAMASERPIVLTSAGGNVELVKDGVEGFFFCRGDKVSLAALIARLGADAALRQALGQAGRKRVESNFSLVRMISRYRQLYLSLARQNAGN